jgi:phosphonate degradation associated HDIG domain protein
MTKEKAVETGNMILEMYRDYGGEEYAGEKLSQLEHMVQAAQLAEKQGCDDEVILAAFLHDIGHLCQDKLETNEMGGFGIVDHETIGAQYLKELGFSEKIVKLVGSHVNAKRYLTCKDPDYYASLSEASKKTLVYQGGKMSSEEAEAFERSPLFDLIIQMRKWDEQAKIENQPIPDLRHYGDLMENHLLSH